jgi:hypothetical protein
MRTILGCALCLWAASAVCAESPSSFAYGIAIRAEGGEALYRLELPRAVYRGAVRPDLGDLRVFNGAGEVVPHAFRPRASVETQKRAPVALPVFPVYGDDPKQLDGLSLRVERNASGTIVQLDERSRAPASTKKLLAYLADATALKDPVRALEFDVKAGAAYAAKVSVEASDDLSAWRRVASEAPLLSLKHEGASLEQRRVEFASRKPKYFRITWSGMPQGAVLAALRAELGDARVDVVRQWESVAGLGVAERPGDYAFDTQGVFPADRVRFELPQENTVAQIQLFSRARSGEAPWRPVIRGTAYRLRRDGTEVSSPELVIGENADRYWLLRVDQRGGGLGSGSPKLVLGWLANEIVWVARGNPPFTLAYGSRDAKPSAYAIESLVPGFRRDADLDAKVASTEQGAVPVKAAEADSPAVLGGQQALEERIDVKRWTLWASLVAGVAFLGWMAWRLVKQMGASAKPGPPKPGASP